jgi:hypothetical protein
MDCPERLILKVNKKKKVVTFTLPSEIEEYGYYKRVESLLERAKKEKLPVDLHIGHSGKIEHIHKIGNTQMYPHGNS